MRDENPIYAAEREESRCAMPAMTELQRVDTGRLAGGVLIIGDRSDALDD